MDLLIRSEGGGMSFKWWRWPYVTNGVIEMDAGD
jgi:hypothetical protein